MDPDLTLFDVQDDADVPPPPPCPADDTWERPLPEPPPADEVWDDAHLAPPADLLAARADDDLPASLQPGAARPGVNVDQAQLEAVIAGLNPDQRAAATSDAPAVVITAGPGSGKTRTITARVARILTGGADPRRVLAVTFTNKAATEMADRLTPLVGIRPGWRTGPAVATFHATCAWMARVGTRHTDHLRPGFSILDTADQLKVLTDVMYPDGLPGDKAAARKEVKVLAHRLSEARNNDCLDDLNGAEAHVLHAYRIRMAALNAIDYDGLLETGVELLADPATGWARRFDHVLVDEFQDTNVAQQQMVEMFRRGGAAVTVCGDFDQSIYAWRGARPDHLAELASRWDGVEVIRLGTNYRSTPQIVTAAAAVIAENEGTWRVDLTTGNADGSPVQVDTPYNVWEEGEMVARRVAADTNPGRHAVLVRARTQTLFIEKALVAARVPYITVGTTAFTDRAEVKDALAWMRVAVNGADRVALARAASAPKRGVGPAALQQVLDAADAADITPVRWLATDGQLAGRSAKAVAGLAAVVRDVLHAAQRGPAALVAAICDDVGLAAHHAGDDELAQVRADNLAALRDDAVAHEDAHGDGWDQTVEWVTTLGLATTAEVDDTDVVTISTAHAAKGREFDVVHVVGVDGRHYPHVNVAEDPAAVAEERRLLFVAMTRARHDLYLTWPLVSKPAFADGAADQPTATSPFLRPLLTLPASVVDASRVRTAPRPQPVAASRFGRGRGGHRTAPTRHKVAEAGRTGTTRSGVAALPARRTGPVHRTAAAPKVRVEVDPGDRVTHDRFGPGTVVAVSADRVTVAFDTAGEKLMTRTAPIRKAA